MMFLQSGTLLMMNTTYTYTISSYPSSFQDGLSLADTEEGDNRERRNDERSGESCCSWSHSAILLHSGSATVENCTFINMNHGALSVDHESTLAVNDVAFQFEGDYTPD